MNIESNSDPMENLLRNDLICSASTPISMSVAVTSRPYFFGVILASNIISTVFLSKLSEWRSSYLSIPSVAILNNLDGDENEEKETDQTANNDNNQDQQQPNQIKEPVKDQSKSQENKQPNVPVYTNISNFKIQYSCK